MADDQVVTTSERLWSEECEAIDGGKEDKTAYEFNNGRKFESAESLYDQPQPES